MPPVGFKMTAESRRKISLGIKRANKLKRQRKESHKTPRTGPSAQTIKLAQLLESLIEAKVQSSLINAFLKR